MRFLNDIRPPHELTYNDVFMVPSLNEVPSRLDVDLSTPDRIGTSLPIVVANMTAVAGRRMAETAARRGALTILPQDIPLEIVRENIEYVKSRHLVYDTPVTLTPTDTVQDGLFLISKRAHGAAVVTDHDNVPVGIFTERDAAGYDRFTQLRHVMRRDLVTIEAGTDLETIFEHLTEERLNFAPVVEDSRLVGVVTRKGALRSTLYRPAVDRNNRLMVGVAVGINADVEGKINKVIEYGADVIVIDTAHGHQTKTLRITKAAHALAPHVPIVAGNVVTAEGTADLIEAGADIVKVGVGPGAMCTTRMMTGVGRPQFSAVLECASEARRLDRTVWADGGVRYPRDVALALAAGAANVMFGTLLAGTAESAADAMRDSDGRLYKESFGMASHRAVKNRTRDESAFTRAAKELFEEGISTSRLYLDHDRPGVEDIIDQIVAGVRSACTYSGAASIEDFARRAVIGLQSAAGYDEGRPVGTNW